MSERNPEQSFTNRERALIDRGYAPALVAALSICDGTTISAIAEEILRELSERCAESPTPECIILGGQPGSGKSVWSRRFNERTETAYAEISLDACRSYHPGYLRIEEVIRSSWVGATPDDDHSPGNDIADFTHHFAGNLSDAVIGGAIDRRMNMILEWGLRNPEEPLRLMEMLKQQGYRVVVLYIATDARTSMEACRLRAAVMNSGAHIMRQVPIGFHTIAVEAMPDSCARVYGEAVRDNDRCDDFQVVTRSGEVLWRPGAEGRPEEVYAEYLHREELPGSNAPEEAWRSMEAELRGLRPAEIVNT